MSSLAPGLIVAGWLFGFLLYGRPRTLPKVHMRPDAPGPRVSVIVPVRNDADALPKLLVGLRRQTLRPAEVIVVDDDSSDGSIDIATTLGSMVITAPGAPAGWNPKSWASWVGARAATGRVFVFMDPGAQPKDHFIERLVITVARKRGIVSVLPFENAESPIEKLEAISVAAEVMGSGVGHGSHSHGAFGSCLAVRSSDYFDAGGHEARRGDITDDVSLMRSFRDSGLPTYGFIGGRDLAVTDAGYTHRGLIREWTGAFRRAGVIRAVGTLVWLSSLVVSAAWLAAWLAGFDRGVIPVATYAAVATQVYLMTRRLGTFGIWSAIAFPILSVGSLVVVVETFIRSVARRPVVWKDRTVAPAS